MLYHIVSGSSKLGQFRWSGFFSYQQIGTFFTGINYRRLLPDRTCLYSLSIFFRSNLLKHFSRATFSTKLYHIVSGSSKLGQFRWSGFLPYQWTGNIFTGINYRRLLPDRNRLNSLFYLSQVEFSGTFLTSHISTMLYHIVSGSSKLGQFRWSGFFSYQQTGTNFNGIYFLSLLSDRNRWDLISISPKSNLLEHFSQATFPQCYIILCQDRQNWVSSDGLDFFSIHKPELFSNESTTCIYYWTGTA